MRKPTFCITCGKERNPCSRKGRCITCITLARQKTQYAKEIAYLQENGYEIISGPLRNKLGKAVYCLIRKSCHHEYTAVFHNIRKQILIHGVSPCSKCGAEKRMLACMAGFMQKHGRNYDLSVYQDYRSRVYAESEKSYRANKHLINPNNLRRGHTDWHLDHIVPVIQCFKHGVPVEKASSAINLQMLPYGENIRKHGKLDRVLLERLLLA